MAGPLGLLLTAVAVSALAATSIRIASHFSRILSMRLLSAVAIFAALATIEALLLGIVRLGGNGWVLCLAAVVTGCLAWKTISPADNGVHAQLRTWWHAADAFNHIAASTIAVVAIIWSGYLAWNPYIGGDALVYHLTEPALWLHNGRPGSFVLTQVGLPVEAYPKGAEVLFTWFIALARTPVILFPVLTALWVTTLTAAHVGLRRLGVERAIAAAAALSIALLPIFVGQLVGPDTDLICTAWLVLAASLCAGSIDEPLLAWVALVAGGLSIGTKSTSEVLVVVLLVTTFAYLRHRLVLTWATISMGLAGMGLAVIWPIRNFITYGAPLYPFLSFPAGPPVPFVIRRFGATFIGDPVGAVRIAHVSGYARAGGSGVIFLVAAVPLTLIIAIGLLPKKVPISAGERRLRLATLALSAVIGLECLFWASSPFSGWSGYAGTQVLVVGGLRYLLPGFAAASCLIALCSRIRPLMWPCLAILVVGVLYDLDRLRISGYPYRPSDISFAAMVVVGILLGWLLHRAPWRGRRLLRVPSVAWFLLPFVLILLIVPENHYLTRHLVVSRITGVDQGAVLSWMSQQPGWSKGNVGVAIGPDADVSFMGPNFDHPLTVVNDNTPCSAVRAYAAKGWLILTEVPNGGLFDVRYPITNCMYGVTPVFKFEMTSVYAPHMLTSAATP